MGIVYKLRKLFLHERPVRLIIAKLLYFTKLCSLFTINRGLYRIYFHPTSISIGCFLNPAERKDDEDFLKAFLKPGDVVVDVGANIGNITLTSAALVGNSGKIFSIEPHPVIFKYLCRNIRLNNLTNIDVINSAVSDFNGVICFSNKALDDLNEVVKKSNLRVNTRTLDKILSKKVSYIDLLKIDVEGFEINVLRGASNILGITKCVYYESEEKHCKKYGYTTANLIDILQSAGFNIYKLHDNKLVIIRLPYVSKENENLLAIRDISDFVSRTNFLIRD